MRGVERRLLLAAAAMFALACGARTALHAPPPDASVTDAGTDASDAASDVPDAPDATPDAIADSGPDVFDAAPDVHHTSCQEAGITYIYLISSENELLRFYPPSLNFRKIGTINCPTTTPGDTPFSMAVDRSGIAYVLFQSGDLFRVSTLTASCKATPFVSDPNFGTTFGMGFSADLNDPGETLYIAANSASGNSAGLGTIDLTTFNLTPVAPFTQPIGNPELTGTGDGRLFGFGPGAPDSHIARIDKTTARITNDVILNLQQSQFSAWAFAFWGGDFYTFTSSTPGHSVVHRYTPGGSTTPPVVATTSYTIVGAGVSTCAPSR